MSCTAHPRNPNATDASTTGRFDERPRYVVVHNRYATITSTPESRRRERIRELNRKIRRMFSL